MVFFLLLANSFSAFFVCFFFFLNFSFALHCFIFLVSVCVIRKREDWGAEGGLGMVVC